MQRKHILLASKAKH